MPDTNTPASAPTPAPMPTPAPKKDYSALYIPAAIVIAGIIIGAAVLVAFKGTTTQQAGGQQPTVAVDVKDVKITDDTPYIGDKNAKVTMVAWEDYQCPFCKAVEVGHQQIQVPPAMPDLVKDYVKTGKLRIVYKDYPFLGDDSKVAALYEHAVWRLYPDKFFEWREAMFNAQDEEGDQGFGDEPSILKLVKTIPGLDADKLKADVTKNVAVYTKIADDDRAEGAKYGIQGTPGFIVGKTLIPGAVGIADFKNAIDPLLK